MEKKSIQIAPRLKPRPEEAKEKELERLKSIQAIDIQKEYSHSSLKYPSTIHLPVPIEYPPSMWREPTGKQLFSPRKQKRRAKRIE